MSRRHALSGAQRHHLGMRRGVVRADRTVRAFRDDRAVTNDHAADRDLALGLGQAQGVATLPLAATRFLGFWMWSAFSGSAFPMPLGNTPAKFVGRMLVIGLMASWLGTLCWNAASQRLPTTLSGQLIVFETLSALAFAFALRGRAPGGRTLAGVALLVPGVAWALRVRPEPAAAEGHAACGATGQRSRNSRLQEPISSSVPLLRPGSRSRSP